MVCWHMTGVGKWRGLSKEGLTVRRDACASPLLDPLQTQPLQSVALEGLVMLESSRSLSCSCASPLHVENPMLISTIHCAFLVVAVDTESMRFLLLIKFHRRHRNS